MPKEKANTERVSTFISKEALDKLNEEAKRLGMTVSGLIRFLILERLNAQTK